jgi:ferredoxin
MAIFQGRRAAEAVHARLRGLSPPALPETLPPTPPRVKLALYETRRRAEVSELRPAERLARPEAEVVGTLDIDTMLGEASRCLSCGGCFGCQRCWMYCNPGGYTPLDEVAPGAYFAFDHRRCEGCGKCIDLCPCGFLTLC